MMTDPVADMITRIRNGVSRKKEYVDVPASKIKAGIAKVLHREGYISNIKYYDDGLQGVIRIYLRYPGDDSAIEKIERVSRPSRRVYVGKGELPRVMGGFGTAIISTSQGLLTDKECRRAGIGGELICQIW
jgi:small subunit ribosomal protein S8